MSEVAQDTSAWPLAVSPMRTVIGTCSASQTPVAMPQPTSSLPSRIKRGSGHGDRCLGGDRKSTRLNSSHLGISYAVFCFKKKKNDPDFLYESSPHLSPK